MASEEFIENLKKALLIPTKCAVIDTLFSVPGRSPDIEKIELSRRYNNLDNETKKIIDEIIGLTISQTIFDILCILDGVASIENTVEKGQLELNYISPNGEVSRLNNNDEDYLHDIFRD